MENDYPLYIVRKENYAIWKRWQDTNLYMSDLKEELEFRRPYDWWTYQNLTEKCGFFPIDSDQYNMYDRLKQQLSEKVEKEIQELKGCGWDIDE